MKSTPIATRFVGIVKTFSTNSDLQGVFMAASTVGSNFSWLQFVTN